MSSTSPSLSLSRTLNPGDSEEFEFVETEFVNDFTDFKFLAANAHCTVHSAVECATNKVYAVKTVVCPFRTHPNMYASHVEGGMAKDFTLLGKVKHPHVLEIIAVYSPPPGMPGDTHLVFEFMPGGTLLEYLLNYAHEQPDNGLQFPEGLHEIAARDIMFQLCQALSYIHRLGIVHCNVKPENILLTGDEMPFIKLAGFGLAIKGAGNKRDVRGSMDYAAPELLDHRDYDEHVDSWSAGITMCNLLLLASPHVSGHHNAGEPLELEWDTLRERLSEDGDKFLHALLTEDPKDRWLPDEALRHNWLFYHRQMYPNVVYK
ncbi:kinase-like domain-containing protein [Mycena belliarum]|uniref:Kinase-like domain-containing protein n=1 Tax=Mycena belliarum TaxID=1033014 RepID=A0AAD6U917_9AGAR|nr:kinase-like domain-containing protein [Mycena belliae]